jgi:flagellin-like hook-associated protein FlgL
MSQATSVLLPGPKIQTAVDPPARHAGLVDQSLAQEVSAFSPDEILTQSGVAMLGQARQAAYLVLTLLRC